MGKDDYVGANWASSSKGKETATSKTALTQVTSSGSVEQIEDVNGNLTTASGPKTKLSKRQRLRKHFRRFWICYAIGAFVALAVGLPVLFLVIIPALAQRMVNEADLPIHAVSINNPTPDTVEVSLSTSLKVPGGFSVRLDPLVLQLYDPEEADFVPFVEVAIPGQKLKGTTKIEIKNQQVTIDDRARFIKFLRNSVMSEKFTMAARGKTRAHLGALHADVKLDKKVTLDGLNSLKGFSINSATAIVPPAENGTNLATTLTIPNPSVVAFDLGNETLSLLAGPLHLGTALIPNVSIRPGNNTFSATGTLDLRAVLRNLPQFLAYQAEPLGRGMLKMGARGNSTVFRGQHITYFEEILGEVMLEAEVSVVGLLATSLGEILSGGGLPGLGGNETSGGGNLTQMLQGLNITKIVEEFSGGGKGGGSSSLWPTKL